MATMSAIRMADDLKAYSERKIAAKNKMLAMSSRRSKHFTGLCLCAK